MNAIGLSVAAAAAAAASRAIAAACDRVTVPVKILYLMDRLHWGDIVAGTEGQFLQLLTNLDRDRFEPHLAVLRPTAFTDSAARFSCPIRVLNIEKLLSGGSVFKLAKLAALIRTQDIRVVHIFLNDAAIAAPLFCRIGGAHVLVSRRDMGFWYSRGILAALRVSNLFVDRIVANSDAVRKNVHSREHYPLDKIAVCYNGHDPARFDALPEAGFRERLGIGASDPIIGMVANFNPWKRHVDLVHAFARVRQQHPSAHLVLAGAGDLEPARAAAQALGVTPAVHFTGTVADAVPLVKHFAVGVLCSESEGLSNSVIEYMGCAKPTVCTNAGGNSEAVTDGVNGFLVRPGDVDTLAARIGTLLAEPMMREQMGRRAREAALQFTIRKMADSHMALYDEMVISPTKW